MSKYEIKKCSCGYYRIYKKSFFPFVKPKPLQYLYREIFCEAWVNRSFESDVAAKVFISYPLKIEDMPRYVSGEYCDKNKNICQIKEYPGC